MIMFSLSIFKFYKIDALNQVYLKHTKDGVLRTDMGSTCKQIMSCGVNDAAERLP